MRLMVFTDVHANLPALQAICTEIGRQGYDLAIHLGDAIAIGPYPAECVDILLNLPRRELILGNHDDFYVNGIPEALRAEISEGEQRHQLWTHALMGQGYRTAMAEWRKEISGDYEGVRLTFLHYERSQEAISYLRVIHTPRVVDLDRLFERRQAEALFFGHDHGACDLQGRLRYVNPGSAGCHSEAIARYCRLEIAGGKYSIEHCQAPYDDASLYQAFEQRQTPEREFIYEVFFGGRFKTISNR